MTISQLNLETSSKPNRCLRGKCAFGLETTLPDKETKGDLWLWKQFLVLKAINILCIDYVLNFYFKKSSHAFTTFLKMLILPR